MTEKRFTNVEVNETGSNEEYRICMYDDGNYIRYSEKGLENIMNSLSEENEQLKKEMVKLGIDHTEEITRLEKENNFLQKSKNRQQLSAEEGSKIIEQLVEENKQLKEKIKIYENFLDLNDLTIDWDDI